MVEVLDHYHGPCSRKLWLLAFAESANDSTRAGWCPRWKLAHRADVSPSRASHIAAELAAEGVVKRDGGGYRGAPVRYVLAPLAERVRPDSNLSGAGKGAPRSNLTGAGKGASGAGKGASGDRKGAPRQQPIPHIPQEPSSAREAADIIRAVFPGATDDEIEIIARDKNASGARSLGAVLAHEVREGTLRLPCDRDGPGRHSGACRVGDPRGCVVGWCGCRCHTEPAREAAP